MTTAKNRAINHLNRSKLLDRKLVHLAEDALLVPDREALSATLDTE